MKTIGISINTSFTCNLWHMFYFILLRSNCSAVSLEQIGWIAQTGWIVQNRVNVLVGLTDQPAQIGWSLKIG